MRTLYTPRALAVLALVTVFAVSYVNAQTPDKSMNDKTVSEGKKVSIDYSLSVAGEQIESSKGKEPLTYEHGRSQIIPGLEKELEGMEVGQSKQVTVAPAEGYGQVDNEALIEVDKEQIPPEAQQIGAAVMTTDKQGNTLRARVKEVNDDKVLLDFNHPLAGKTLDFDIKIVEVESDSAQAAE